MIDDWRIESDPGKHILSDVFLHDSAVLEMPILIVKLVFDSFSSELFKYSGIILLFFTVKLVWDVLRDLDALLTKGKILQGHLMIASILLDLSFAHIDSAMILKNDWLGKRLIGESGRRISQIHSIKIIIDLVIGSKYFDFDLKRIKESR